MGVEYHACEPCGESIYEEDIFSCEECGNYICSDCYVNNKIVSDDDCLNDDYNIKQKHCPLCSRPDIEKITDKEVLDWIEKKIDSQTIEKGRNSDGGLIMYIKHLLLK